MERRAAHSDRERQEIEQARGRLGMLQKDIDSRINGYFDAKIEEARSIDERLVGLLESGHEFVARGGKRLRPAFFVSGYQAAGGTDFASALSTSLSLEILHAGILVHDDIVDNSDLRRSKPTVHEQLGRSMAILVGNTLVAYAAQILGTSGLLKGERGLAARKIFDQMCLEVSLGQLIDTLGNTDRNVSREAIFELMKLKTASYTIVRPLQLGAILAGATNEQLAGLENYGMPLGIAFQLQDDILGTFGDEKRIGKPVGSDLREGKKTLLVFETLAVLDQSGKTGDIERFLALLGNQDISPEDIEWIRGKIVETGSLQKTVDLVSELARKASLALDNIEINQEERNFLRGVALLLAQRDH